MKYQAVFFDYDGVLTLDRSGSYTTKKYISWETGVEIETLSLAFDKYNNDLLLGKFSHVDVWSQICAAIGTDINFGVLERAFMSTPMNIGMFEIASKLKEEFEVGIITDNKSDRISFLRKYQNLDAIFYPIVVSAEIGADKNDESTFRYALSQISVQPERAVFIDNNRDNLAAAERIGMTTMYHDDSVNDVLGLREDLREILELGREDV